MYDDRELRAVSFGEGMTPLVSRPRIGRTMGVPGLLMKDENPAPTGTFKARGAVIGVSRAALLRRDAGGCPGRHRNRVPGSLSRV